MIRSEIKDFYMNVGEERVQLTPPFSLYESLCNSSSLDKAFCTATFDGTPLLNKGGYIYLRITDATGLCAVRVGASTVFSGCFSGAVLNLNVKDYLLQGENRLELEFVKVKNAHAPGLFGSCQLLSFPSAAIDRVVVKQRLEGGSAVLDISLDMLGNSDSMRAVATLVSSAGQIFYSGITRGKGTIKVKDPLLWWPKGMGVQNLYRLTVNLYGDMEVEDTVEMRVGIRKLDVFDNKTVVEICGMSYLPMGAVYRTELREDPRISSMRESAFINSAARVGMNALLIRSDDVLPSNSFFDLCDAHGIAVIREINASKLDESNDEVEQLARISHHASMAIYNIIYDTGNAATIRDRLSKIDPNIAVRINDKAMKYPQISELPSDRVTNKYLTEDERNLFSEKMESVGRKKLLDMIEFASERYPYASGFADFAYISSVAAAEYIRGEMITARLSRGEKPVIYDGLGDRDGLVCLAGIDSSAVWRATHYYAASFLAPLCLYPNHLGDGRVEFYISNERTQSFVGKLEYRIADNKNKTIHRGTFQCAIERTSVRLAGAVDFGEYIKGRESECYLEYYLSDPLGVFSRGTMLFVPEKHFKFANPNISAQIVGSDRRFSITLTSCAFAKAVEISFESADAVFYDNYFDLTSDSPVKISFSITGGIESAENLMNTLRVKSIYDVKRP